MSRAEYAPSPVPPRLPWVAYFSKIRLRTSCGTSPMLLMSSDTASPPAPGASRRRTRTSEPSGAASTAFFSRLATVE
jgi:hypothetical protein